MSTFLEKGHWTALTEWLEEVDRTLQQWEWFQAKAEQCLTS